MNSDLNNPLNPQPIPDHGLTENLTKDLKVLAGDTNHLLKDASCAALRELAARRDVLTGRARDMLGATEQLAKGRPWTVIGIAATAGLVIGAWLSRR